MSTYKKDLQNLPDASSVQFPHRGRQQCSVRMDFPDMEIIFIKDLPKDYVNKVPEAGHDWWKEWHKEINRKLKKLGY